MKSYRIQSLDLLRGLVMVIMALDHVRDYFHADAFLYDPLDLSKTSVVLFFTRWITHFCAPTFVFLSGTSAFLVGARKGKKELTKFLLTRGAWLIFLELVVFNFGWFFNLQFPLIPLIVIWAIGVGFIVLAAAIQLPFNAILTIGLVLIFGHNALDGFQVTGNEVLVVLWSILHQQAVFPITEGHVLFVGYPLIPWVGVTMVGYCFGKLYVQDVDVNFRKKVLLYLGSSAIILFIILRFFNIYGDSNHWTTQPSPVYSFLSFLNISKYPPSLLYLLVTLGPAILFLRFTEGLTTGGISKRIIVLGRVPMFYYLVHIYAIHILAIGGAAILGYNISTMVFNT
ncbi:MAG TPA: heparan-alpha-glucosaminide N-acetyltransferase domain-containing protein, partial [Cyclobacteriaceae bacterium]